MRLLIIFFSVLDLAKWTLYWNIASVLSSYKSGEIEPEKDRKHDQDLSPHTVSSKLTNKCPLLLRYNNR